MTAEWGVARGDPCPMTSMYWEPSEDEDEGAQDICCSPHEALAALPGGSRGRPGGLGTVAARIDACTDFTRPRARAAAEELPGAAQPEQRTRTDVQAPATRPAALQPMSAPRSPPSPWGRNPLERLLFPDGVPGALHRRSAELAVPAPKDTLPVSAAGGRWQAAARDMGGESESDGDSLTLQVSLPVQPQRSQPAGASAAGNRTYLSLGSQLASGGGSGDGGGCGSSGGGGSAFFKYLLL
ncbi:hypothetical protein T492DRAFT_836742 [Pavlovales sp. CCMP2436]|nr:hypothetical protein T492DRAFT_836742 [Pavlovales sp. CCMP2436]